MVLLIYGGTILTGFVLGYFFATPVIVVITVIAAILALVLRPRREQELGALVGVIAWIILGVGSVAMWGTHLYVTGVDLGIPDLSSYIFRKH